MGYEISFGMRGIATQSRVDVKNVVKRAGMARKGFRKQHIGGLEEPQDVQNIFSEAPLPFSLVEEVVEVAAEGDENKAKSQKSKYTC